MRDGGSNSTLTAREGRITRSGRALTKEGAWADARVPFRPFGPLASTALRLYCSKHLLALHAHWGLGVWRSAHTRTCQELDRLAGGRPRHEEGTVPHRGARARPIKKSAVKVGQDDPVRARVDRARVERARLLPLLVQTYCGPYHAPTNFGPLSAGRCQGRRKSKRCRCGARNCSSHHARDVVKPGAKCWWTEGIAGFSTLAAAQICDGCSLHCMCTTRYSCFCARTGGKPGTREHDTKSFASPAVASARGRTDSAQKRPGKTKQSVGLGDGETVRARVVRGHGDGGRLLALLVPP